jgi:hypothetical protein
VTVADQVDPFLLFPLYLAIVLTSAVWFYQRLSLKPVCILVVSVLTMQLFTKIVLAFAGLSVVNAASFDAEKRDGNGNYRSVAYYVDWVSRQYTSS